MSKPINIFKQGSFINNFNNQYIFQLFIRMKDNTIKNFYKSTSENSTLLYTFNENINYSDIINFNIIITCINISTEKYILQDILTENKNSFTNNDIYIEFKKNNNNLTECYCTINTINNSRLFFTPPNYYY
jgi:hypothetical protein